MVTLGLGIGAATTVYGFAYALLLRPYPCAAPEALLRVQSVYTKEGGARRGMALRDLQDYRRRLDRPWGRETRRKLGLGDPNPGRPAWPLPDPEHDHRIDAQGPPRRQTSGPFACRNRPLVWRCGRFAG